MCVYGYVFHVEGAELGVECVYIWQLYAIEAHPFLI